MNGKCKVLTDLNQRYINSEGANIDAYFEGNSRSLILDGLIESWVHLNVCSRFQFEFLMGLGAHVLLKNVYDRSREHIDEKWDT